MSSLKIVVLERGFVYIGRAVVAAGNVYISDAKCIRRWGTKRGLGQLALEGKQENTVLDPAGKIAAPISALIHTIECDATKWPEFAEASQDPASDATAETVAA